MSPSSACCLTETLDTTFGPNHDGKVITDVSGLGLDDGAMAVAIQPDGKIVVGGHTGAARADGFLLRYNADGSLDESFGVGGKVVTSWATDRDDKIIGVAIQADGKIVVCGSIALEDGSGATARYLARYNADGSLDDGSGNDTTPGDGFGTGGRVDLPFTTLDIGYWNHPIAIQDDGAIVWAGRGFNGTDDDVAVARLTTTGAFDTTFGAVSGSARTGSATIPLAGHNGARSVTIQADGKLVVVGVSEPGFAHRALRVGRHARLRLRERGHRGPFVLERERRHLEGCGRPGRRQARGRRFGHSSRADADPPS